MRDIDKFNQIKKEILDAVERIKEKMPDAAQYLMDHLIFDKTNLTVKYTGDDRLKMDQILL